MTAAAARRHALLLLHALAALLFSPLGAASSACEPLNTLTFACAGQCAGRPCLRYPSLADCTATANGAGETKALSSCVAAASAVSNGTSCAIECFAPSEQDGATRFTFFIPFSLSKLGGRPAENATHGVPSKNEDALKTVAVLDIPDTVTTVTIAGGTNVTDSPKGHAVDVALANWVLMTKTNLRAVTLANIDAGLFPERMFPSTLANLTLLNLFLTTLPSDLPEMTALQHLNVARNYLSKFPTKFGVASLLSLDLSNNVLEAVPASVFAMSKLRFLNLSANAFTGVALTPDQFAFLRAIPTLVVDSFGRPLCAALAQQQLRSATVCVDASVSNSAPHASTSSGTIVGGVLAAVAVAVLVVSSIFWVRRRRSAAARDDKASHYSSSLETESAKQSTNASKHVSAAGDDSSYSHADGARQSFWDDDALASLHLVASGALRPRFTGECPAQVLALALRCLALDPSERPTAYQMFMLKKKKAPVDTTKQIKAIAWDLSKIAVVFVGIRAASVLLNKEAA
ncbi:hypothetical protein PybrP1_002043 [[Pythium] brassicae (nom. inval.)]|nr:hypothetical protein PybrP1_002043 [[Pythium] brassicae (nom. inval.)]